MAKLPRNWSLIEEFEGSFVFENNSGSFSVFIDFDDKKKLPFQIGYEQLEGDFELIELEDDSAFTSSALTLEEAYDKAVLFMDFIDNQITPEK